MVLPNPPKENAMPVNVTCRDDISAMPDRGVVHLQFGLRMPYPLVYNALDLGVVDSAIVQV